MMDTFLTNKKILLLIVTFAFSGCISYPQDHTENILSDIVSTAKEKGYYNELLFHYKQEVIKSNKLSFKKSCKTYMIDIVIPSEVIGGENFFGFIWNKGSEKFAYKTEYNFDEKSHCLEIIEFEETEFCKVKPNLETSDNLCHLLEIEDFDKLRELGQISKSTSSPLIIYTVVDRTSGTQIRMLKTFYPVDPIIN